MKMITRRRGWMLGFVVMASALATPTPSVAQDAQSADLAKELSNPVAALITVPVQYNYDEYGGPNAGARANHLVLQPVIPFSMNKDWNLITRTIIPLADQQGFPLAAANKSGLGDTTASQFFSPKSPTAGGLIWGAGPVELLPTASATALGTGKWGIGPTAVVL
ncbi:MAG: hypothetical protein ACM3QY_11685 [Candidatus Levyibacteriota bacterium]